MPVCTANAAEPLPTTDPKIANEEKPAKSNEPRTINTPLGEFLIVSPDAFPHDEESGTIGVQVGTQKSHLIIRGVAKESPAEKAGLKKDQQILSIDGRSCRGMKLRDAVKALRGKPGTLVVLRIKEQGAVFGKKVPLIRSSASYAEEFKGKDGTPRLRTETLDDLGAKSCPATYSGCHLLMTSDDKKSCSFACPVPE